MPLFLILGVLLVLAILLAYILRLFRIEKIHVEDPAPPAPPEIPESEPQQEEELVNLVDLFADETKAKDSDSPHQLRDIPQTDLLCDLPVGASYTMECQKALNLACESGSRWAVACFDIDRFRFINSLKGMAIGDYVLVNLVAEAKAIFPEDALMTRISADHFSLCFPLEDDAMMVEYADALRHAGERIRADIGIKASLRVCVGYCATGLEPESYAYDLLLHKANIARHCLKVSKSENCAPYNDSMAGTLLYGESSMEDYSDYQYDEEIIAYFQPQSDISKTRIVGAQALARWTFEEIALGKDRPFHPDNGYLPSNARRLVYHACRIMSRWRKSGKEALPVFVCLPPTELFQEDIDEFVLRCAGEFQIEPTLLVLVVDIVSLLISPEVARRQIQKLGDGGCAVAVNGNSHLPERLELLRELPVTYLKIPRALTSGIYRDSLRLTYLAELVQKARLLSMEPVYEGIDDNLLMTAVKQLGGGLVEGRFAGRPVPGDDFAKVLKEFVQKQRITGTSTVILDMETRQSGEPGNPSVTADEKTPLL